MSATTANTSSASVQPLRNPPQAATVAVPQAPSTGKLVPGMGAKALLAKKMPKSANPTFVSPTDNMMTPCTQKITAAKQKHFTKGIQPKQLFANAGGASSDDEESQQNKAAQPALASMDEDDNPF